MVETNVLSLPESAIHEATEDERTPINQAVGKFVR